MSLITIYSVGPDDEVQVTERKALLLDQIDPSGPSIDYFHSSVIMELDNNIQRFEPFKMLRPPIIDDFTIFKGLHLLRGKVNKSFYATMIYRLYF